MTGDSNPTPNAGGSNQDPAGQHNQQQSPATSQQQQGNQQNNQQQQQNQFIISQEQFDQRWAEKMVSLEKELGLPPGGLKDFVATQKKAKTPAPSTGETLSGADLKIARMEALMTAGVPSKQIPLLLQHLNIAGKTREEIQASIGQLIELKLLTIETTPAPQPGNQQDGTPNAAQGAGNPGVSGTPGKKTWKISEIARMSYDDHIKNQDEILKAMSEGRVIEG
jgi:hypothetical protein